MHRGGSRIVQSIFRRFTRHMSKNSTGDMEDVPWRAVHRKALDKGEMSYIDPATGYTAFTELSHLDRGYCCGNTCRHCPYSYENVGHPERIKEQARARRQEKKDARDRKRQQTTQDGKDEEEEESSEKP